MELFSKVVKKRRDAAERSSFSFLGSLFSALPNGMPFVNLH